MDNRTCDVCAHAFEPATSRQRFCSKRCCRENSRAKPKPECSFPNCERHQTARGYCKAHWKQHYGKPVRYPITCVTCGVEHMSARRDGQFCSDACKAEMYRAERRRTSREVVGPVEPNMCRLPDRHPARAKQHRPRLWYAGTCGWCGDAFTDWQPASRYCSPRCGKQAGKARRGRFVIQSSVRMSIYVRDDWTCQLCLEPVDADLVAHDPYNDWAPSLDHIECQSWTLVPDHSPSNLRLAHRWCNAVRGDGRKYTELDLRISRVA